MAERHQKTDTWPQGAVVVPLVPPRSATPGRCLCGGPLNRAGDFLICEHCHRAYCPDCGGPVVQGGGCRSCAVCGYGYCA
jgi:hypothetical protein